MSKKMCDPEGITRNPITGRWIKIGGDVYKRLVDKGLISASLPPQKQLHSHLEVNACHIHDITHTIISCRRIHSVDNIAEFDDVLRNVDETQVITVGMCDVSDKILVPSDDDISSYEPTNHQERQKEMEQIQKIMTHAGISLKSSVIFKMTEENSTLNSVFSMIGPFWDMYHIKCNLTQISHIQSGVVKIIYLRFE